MLLFNNRSLGLSDIHLGRGDLQDACVNPWSEVPTATAALSEFLGTMTLSVAPRLAAENPTLANNDPVYLALVISAMVVVTVHACLGFSGEKTYSNNSAFPFQFKHTM